MKMNGIEERQVLSTNARSELCWFGATCLGVGAYALVLFALDLTAGEGTSEPRLLLLVPAGIALALMALLIAVATRIDRRRFP
jgi:hypothetical protein